MRTLVAILGAAVLLGWSTPAFAELDIPAVLHAIKEQYCFGEYWVPSSRRSPETWPVTVRLDGDVAYAWEERAEKPNTRWATFYAFSSKGGKTTVTSRQGYNTEVMQANHGYLESRNKVFGEDWAKHAFGVDLDRNARIAGLLENLARRPGEVTLTDFAAYELELTIDNANPDDVTVLIIDRMADMLLSSDTLTRLHTARALDGLGPSANRSPRVLPALRRAIAEELQYRRNTSPVRFGPPVPLLNAQIVALSEITGVPYEDLWEHPEQFEQLPPDMELCRSANSLEYCDMLLAEWRAEHP